MKITDLTPYVVQRPGDGNWVFERVDTDEGLVGWGEAGGNAAGTAQSVRAALLELKPDQVGRSPEAVEPIWHQLYRRYTYFGSRGFGTAVAAGIDIALWDLKGQAVGRPVYAGLRPARRSLPRPDRTLQQFLVLRGRCHSRGVRRRCAPQSAAARPHGG